MLTPTEIKMLKYLQDNPQFLTKVQDPNAFTEAIAETRIDRNHRFLLGALDARERTNFTDDERNAQDVWIAEFCDAVDGIVSMMTDRFKVKSNEKGEAWHAVSFQTETGETLSLRIDTTFGNRPNKVWVEVEESPVPKAPKARR